MQLIALVLIFLSILIILLNQFYFKDFTEFQSVDDYEESNGKKGIANSFFKWFYEKFRWAISESDSFKLNMINDTKTNFIRYKFVIGGISAAFFGIVFSSVFGLIVGFVVGWFFPSLIISSQYKTWVKSIAIELPVLVRYVKMRITMGSNMKDTLGDTVDNLSGPLKSLLANALVKINQDGAYEKHLMAIREMVVGGEYEQKIDSVIKRLVNGWQNPSVQTFEDTERFLKELDAARIDQLTSAKRLKFVLMLPLGLGSVFLMVGPVIVSWIMGTMFSF